MESTPIIAGFFPDPSICRVGETYYLVNSSFEYLPGLPIHVSDDLVTWRQIGNALERPSQIAENEGAPSSGIYAPTIRHHDDRFWIAGTNIADLMSGRGHFLLTATDPAGPWSDPVFVPGAMGIDPDIAWDESGRCFLTYMSALPQTPGIVTVQIDPDTGAMLGEITPLTLGTGLAHVEGPHLFRREGWWYLLLAEGGTERGHASTIFRSREITGPYVPGPVNPILSHRSTALPVQNTGHADFVELPAGGWAAVHLGVRPRGRTPGFHVNGRETFLVGVDWVDDWPIIDEDRFDVPVSDHSFDDSFAAQTLDARWIGIGRFPASFSRLVEGGGLLIGQGGVGQRSMLAVRARDELWTAEIDVRVESGSGRVSVRIDDAHEYGVTIHAARAVATLVVGPAEQVVAEAALPGGPVRVRIRAVAGEPSMFGSEQPDRISLAIVDAAGTETEYGPFDGRYVSTEVAGGFTGRVIGIEALDGALEVLRVVYTTDG